MLSIAPQTVSMIGSLVMAVVAGLVSIRFWKTAQEKSVFTVEVLGKSMAYFAIFQLFLGSRALLSGLSPMQFEGIGIFAHAFLFISLAHFSRIGLYIYKPEWRKYVFGSFLVFGAGAMFIMLQQWTYIPPLIAVPSLIAWIGLGTVVFYNMAREREGVKRKKMILLGTGFLMLAVIGPLNSAASTGMQMAAIQSVTVISVLIIAAGVYWKELIRSK